MSHNNKIQNRTHINELMTVKGHSVRGHLPEDLHQLREVPALEQQVWMPLDEGDANPEEDLVPLEEQTVPQSQHRLANGRIRGIYL